jgi:Caspase domain
MSGKPLVPPGSRAVLIGVPRYQDVKYLSYPAVENSVDGMYELLVESGFCGWQQEQVSKIVNPDNAGQLLLQLRRLARDTIGVLLLYFVGHGVLSEQGELCLAISDTHPEAPDATGLEYSKIKRMLHSGTSASTRIVILDCCYSGRAIGLGSADQAQLADLSDTAGAYTLTAADNFADVSSSEDTPRTVFTGELLDLLTRDGIPGGPGGLTLGEIYPQLRSRLDVKGLPHPNQRADDQAAAFVFARNAALPQTKTAEPTEPNYALVVWRRGGRVYSDADGRQYGDTGQDEDINFGADRMEWDIAPWRRSSLKAQIFIVDGRVDRIREVYGIDKATPTNGRKVALRVSLPLKENEIAERLPALDVKLGDEWPSVRGKVREYHKF